MNEEHNKITAETADKIYERYINQKEWTKSGTLTQGEFCEMMRIIILAAVEKAYQKGYIDATGDALKGYKAAQASEPDFPKEIKERWENIQRIAGASRAAQASEPIICPTCHQDMNKPPRNSKYGDCPQCGQGLSKPAQATEIKLGKPMGWLEIQPAQASERRDTLREALLDKGIDCDKVVHSTEPNEPPNAQPAQASEDLTSKQESEVKQK